MSALGGNLDRAIPSTGAVVVVALPVVVLVAVFPRPRVVLVVAFSSAVLVMALFVVVPVVPFSFAVFVMALPFVVLSFRPLASVSLCLVFLFVFVRLSLFPAMVAFSVVPLFVFVVGFIVSVTVLTGVSVAVAFLFTGLLLRRRLATPVVTPARTQNQHRR